MGCLQVSYTTIMKVWTRLRNKAGLPHLRIHDLRHSFASFLVNSGRTLYEVQMILGHSQSIVTERYAHLSTKTLQDASNSASVIIQGALASSMQPRLVQAEVVPLLPDASQPSPAPSQSVEDVAVIDVGPEDRLAA
ncbi:MAG: tyrosine-type recombinase/integrase [Sideroxyarcus sp.]|nr:tyrosine-type recombinase/integrase [Sideroxyarcus sp.]